MGAMAIVNIGNGKGGVNKTSIAMQLALFCVESNKKVVVVDLDGQEDLSRLMGKTDDYEGIISSDLFNEVIDFDKVSIPAVNTWKCRSNTVSEKLFYIPAHHSKLANINNSAEVDLIDRFMANIKELHKRFDYVIIDTPPSLGACQYASLCVSTSSILPCMPDFDTCGPEKITQYFRAYNAAKRTRNPGLPSPIVVLTSVDVKSNIVQSYIKWAKDSFKTQLVERYIERSAAILNSNSERRAVWSGSTSGNDRAKGASYRRVIESIFERLV